MGRTSTRDRVFETNSSSTHSVTVAEDDLHSLTFPEEMLREGSISISLRGYGWEWARYYRPENKLTYLLAQASGNHSRTREICSIVEEHTGCRVVIDPSTRERAGIDPESSGTGWEVTRSPEALMGFLLSAGSFVQTGNDNSGCGETIETDLGPQIFHVDHYADAPAGEGRFRIRFDHGMKEVLFETGGETVGISTTDYMGKLSIWRAFSDATVLSAVVSPTNAGYRMQGDAQARDLVHGFLSEALKTEDGKQSLKILRDAVVAVGPAPDGPFRREGVVRYDTEATFELRCAAAPESVARLRAAVVAAPDVPAFGRINP